MTKTNIELEKRHVALREVSEASSLKSDVLEHLAKTHSGIREELMHLENLRAEHWVGEVSKEAYLQKLEELTGVDYTPVYDAAFHAHDKQNMKSCVTALVKSIGDRFQRDG